VKNLHVPYLFLTKIIRRRKRVGVGNNQALLQHILNHFLNLHLLTMGVSIRFDYDQFGAPHPGNIMILRSIQR